MRAAIFIFELVVLFAVAWALIVWVTHWVVGWYTNGRPCARLCPRCGGCMNRRLQSDPWTCPLCLWQKR
jgi:hypothetical protein